jgi:transposase
MIKAISRKAYHISGREIARFGHTVRLMTPQYVKAYVKRQKNNRADAEAICEAVQRPQYPSRSPGPSVMFITRILL